jgi:hypothetical protein
VGSQIVSSDSRRTVSCSIPYCPTGLTIKIGYWVLFHDQVRQLRPTDDFSKVDQLLEDFKAAPSRSSTSASSLGVETATSWPTDSRTPQSTGSLSATSSATFNSSLQPPRAYGRSALAIFPQQTSGTPKGTTSNKTTLGIVLGSVGIVMLLLAAAIMIRYRRSRTRPCSLQTSHSWTATQSELDSSVAETQVV